MQQEKKNRMQAEEMAENWNRADDDEIEIDLKQLFFEFKNKILIILLAGVLCAGIAGVFSKVVMQPVYTSTSVLYVLTKETTLTSLADLQIGSQLTQDYKELIMSRSVMEQVVDNLGLNMDYTELQGKISIDNPTDTRILKISVDDSDPVMAKTITDEVASCSSEFIADIMEMDPPKIFETGEIPIYKTSPHVGRNTVIGGLLGMLAVMGLITLNVVMNDSVNTEDDVLKYLGLPVLAVVPEVNASKKKSAHKHSEKHREASEAGNHAGRKKEGGNA